MNRFYQVCFVAGTPLVMDLDGTSKPIEAIEVGEFVLARSEFDSAGPLELKRVEEKFVRTAVVMELMVRPVDAKAFAAVTTAKGFAHGDQSSAFELAYAEFDQEAGNHCVATQSIKTTAEHPFFVPARGEGGCGAFVPAGELQPGEQLVSHDGQLIEIVSVNSSDEITTVYNLRVADHHTYFVGGEVWGWDVWVHNSSYTPSRADLGAVR